MATHRTGYARISTRGQNLDLQVEVLNKAGCDKIYKDTISGTKSQRPASTRLWTICATVTPWWFGSWTPGPERERPPGLRQRTERPRIGFVSLTEAIETTTASGRFFFNVMASLAPMERELINLCWCPALHNATGTIPASEAWTSGGERFRRGTP